MTLPNNTRERAEETRTGTTNRLTSTPWRRVGREVLIGFAAALVYFGVRGLTESSAAQAIENAERIIRLEKLLGIFWEAELQDLLTTPDGATTLANWVYIWGHWPVIAVVAVWLIRTRPYTYYRTRDAFLLSGAVGIVIFALFPVAPPRLTDLDVVDTVTDFSRSYRVLQPPAFTNQYAAMPSLHFGWNLLIGIALYREGRGTIIRPLGVILPVAMAVAVVITANHYILDPIAGGTLALAALGATALPLFRRRHAALAASHMEAGRGRD